MRYSAYTFVQSLTHIYLIYMFRKPDFITLSLLAFWTLVNGTNLEGT